MDDTEMEAIPDPMDLKPQLFIDEVINTVADFTDDAFSAFYEEASKMMKTDSTNRSDELSKGIDGLHKMVQADLDEQMSLWESFCLRKIFAVPEGFSLAETNESLGESSFDQENAELDRQLDSIRSKLSTVGKETAELKRELKVLERQSTLRNQRTESVNEVLALYEQSCDQGMFEEIMKTAAELRKNMERIKRQKMEDNDRKRIERIRGPNIDLYQMSFNGLSNVELKDLKHFTAGLKKI